MFQLKLQVCASKNDKTSEEITFLTQFLCLFFLTNIDVFKIASGRMITNYLLSLQMEIHRLVRAATRYEAVVSGGASVPLRGAMLTVRDASLNS